MSDYVPTPEEFKPSSAASVVIENKDDRVVLDLGLMQIVMTAEQAEETGSALLWHAAALRGGVEGP